MNPAPELVAALAEIRAGRALDLACGRGRHAFWLSQHGWDVMAVDQAAAPDAAVTIVIADLEAHVFTIQPAAWDLIICWLYWQPDLVPEIVRGVRPGGIVAVAGKTTGRFATSLALYREHFTGWTELASGENQIRTFLIARKPVTG